MTSLSAARIRVNQNVISATPSILYFQDQESWFPIQLIPRFTDIKCWNDREIQSKATARSQLIDGKNTKLESKVKFWIKTNQKFPHQFRYTCSQKGKRRISARRGGGGLEGGCGGGTGMKENSLSYGPITRAPVHGFLSGIPKLVKKIMVSWIMRRFVKQISRWLKTNQR